MIDFNVKFAVVAVIAWLLTMRVTPANAAAAQRLWLAVAASPVLWLAGEWLFAPVAVVGFRQGTLPDVVTAPAAAWRLGVGIYLCIAGALFLRTLRGVRAVQRMVRRARALPPSELGALRALAGHPTLDIREGDLAVPVTAGFVRPVVILPADWRAIRPDGLTTILRHEAAHVRRKDCLAAVCCALAEAVLWVNPAIWLAGSRVRWFAEMACDSEAARAMGGERYASELLGLAVGWSQARRPLYRITAGAETDVARRIRLLLDETERGWRRRALLPVAAAVLLIIMPAAAKVRVTGTVIGAPEHGWHHAHASTHRH